MVEQKAESKIMSRRFLIIFLSLCAGAFPAWGRVIRVPAEYPVIQAGIDAALDEDTVLVASGIYSGEGNFDLDFAGKAILVSSESGPESTIIDADEAGRGFYFHRNETSASVLKGFKIINGYVPSESCGGGIFCYYSSPTIRGNIITECDAYWGGGIGFLYASPTIDGNLIVDNTSDRGGGIASLGATSAVISGNTIINNYARGG